MGGSSWTGVASVKEQEASKRTKQLNLKSSREPSIWATSGIFYLKNKVEGGRALRFRPP
jgi:hypothetical protein